jgi:hypothetical protein
MSVVGISRQLQPVNDSRNASGFPEDAAIAPEAGNRMGIKAFTLQAAPVDEINLGQVVCQISGRSPERSQ